MTKITNRTILITGGASGIGKLLAARCLTERAYKVILWDIDEQKLNQAKAELEQENHRVSIYKVDVSSLEQIQKAAQTVRDTEGVVDILFNNAGIVVGKPFAEQIGRASVGKEC